MDREGRIYDVFVSYSYRDRAWVWSWFIPKLRAERFRVCTDRESFDVGVPALFGMEAAVMASRHTVLVLTPAYVTGEWLRYQALLVQAQDPIGLRQRTLPVLCEPCEPRPRDRMLTYVDLTGTENLLSEFDRLCRSLRRQRRTPAYHLRGEMAR